MKRILFLLMAFWMSPLSANSVDDAIATEQYAQLSRDSKEGYLRDEQVDIRTGTLSYNTTDVQLEGRGPDIILSRSSQLSETAELANWKFNIPRLVITTGPNGIPKGGDGGSESHTGICHNINTDIKYYPQSKPADSNYNAAPTLYLQDGAGRYIFETSSSLKGSHFPQNAQFVTKQNDLISCLSVDGRMDGFKVRSSDGLTYYLTVVGKQLGFSDFSKPGKSTIYASKIEDRNGNQVHFEYDFLPGKTADGRTDPIESMYHLDRRIGPYLKKVSANDGRLVEINYNYQAILVQRLPSDEPFYFKYPVVDAVNAIASSGKIRTWRYKYSYFDLWPDHSDNRTAHLKKVIYPDGTSWEYEYEDPRFLVGSHCCFRVGSYAPLLSVKIPSGAIINYKYQKIFSKYFNGFYTFYHNTIIPAILSKEVRDPVTDVSYLWRYSFTYNEDANFSRTTVNRPDDSVERTWYHRSGLYKGKHYRTEIRDSEGVLLRKVEKEYESSSFKLGGFEKSPYTRPTEKYVGLKRRIVDDKYTWEVEARDNWFRPTRIRHKGDKERFKNIVYALSDLSANSEGPFFPNLRIKEEFSANGKTASIEREFDERGNLTGLNKFGRKLGEFGYDEQGRRVSRTEFGQFQITDLYSDFELGKPQKTTHSNGVYSITKYNDFGDLIKTQDASFRSKTYSYDSGGRVTAREISGLEPTTVSYSNYASPEQPQTKKIYKSGSLFKEFHYDGLGRVVFKATYTSDERENSKTSTVQSKYDYLGNVIHESYSHPLPEMVSYKGVAELAGTSYRYDALGRMIEKVEREPYAVTSYCYDSLCTYSGITYPVQSGHLKIDPAGFIEIRENECYQSRSHCFLNHVSESRGLEADWKWISTSLEHDFIGNLLSIKRDGVIRSFQYYPGTDLISQKTQPETGTKSFFYHPDGSVDYITGNNLLVGYSYNIRGQLASLNYNGSEVTIETEYEANGNISRITRRGDGVTELGYRYTPFNSISEQTLSYGETSETVSYDYNSNGDMSAMHYPNGDYVEFFPDLAGNPTLIQLNGKEQVRVSRGVYADSYTFANGVTQLNRKDTRGRVIRQKGFDHKEDIINRVYKYDVRGNLSENLDSIRPSRNVTYRYDGINQLISGNTNFEYDSYSNLTKIAGRSIEYDTKNLVQSVSIGSKQKTYSHDEHGRMIKIEENGEVTHNFFYSPTDRLKELKIGSETLRYEYDPFGNLVSTARIGDSGSGVYEILVRDLNDRLIYKQTFDDSELKSEKTYYYLNSTLLMTKSSDDNEVPSVNIENVELIEGAHQKHVVLRAKATDSEDGDISESVRWESDSDGYLGDGANLTIHLSPGRHRITAVVIDSEGAKSKTVWNSGPEGGILTVLPGIDVSGSYIKSKQDSDYHYQISLNWHPTSIDHVDVFLNDELLKANINGDRVDFNVVNFSSTDTFHICKTSSKVCSKPLGLKDLEILDSPPSLSNIELSGDVLHGQQGTLTAMAMDREEGDIGHKIEWYYQYSPPAHYSLDTDSVSDDQAPGWVHKFGEETYIGKGNNLEYSFSSAGSYRVIAKVADEAGQSVEASGHPFFRALDVEIVSLAPFVEIGARTWIYKFRLTNIQNAPIGVFHYGWGTFQKYSSSAIYGQSPDGVDVRVCLKDNDVCTMVLDL